MNGDPHLYEILKELNISFEYHEHPPVVPGISVSTRV